MKRICCIREVSDTNKCIHRYYPDVEKKIDDENIQADDKGFFTLEKGAKIYGQMDSLKIGNITLDNSINSEQLNIKTYHDKIDSVDQTKLAMECYSHLEKILDYLIKLAMECYSHLEKILDYLIKLS
jgi:hypothetical protein